ncbi:hypothetical protein QC590_12615 [Pseudomonas putida]|uniref:hypothetical protein n=1 Tax=Pseudomonas putida TaxID=303 RepID=UPI0033528D1B
MSQTITSPGNNWQQNEPFFSNPENLNLVRKSRIKIEEYINLTRENLQKKDVFILDCARHLLAAIESSPGVFDENCTLNIDYIGSSFLAKVSDAVQAEGSSREEVLWMCYRFLIELQVSMSADLSRELNKIVHSVHDYQWAESTMLQLKYAEHQMLVGVAKKILHHPGMLAIRDLPETIDKVRVERAAFEAQVASREERIEALRANLERYESAFNFVALYDGFKSLRNQKRREGFIGLLWMSVLGALMLTPFVGKLYLLFEPRFSANIDIYTYFSILGLELVLLFLFKVALHGHRAVKAQLIQLDLRMALCQFIQGYATYASEVRKNDPQLLDKFDQLIFSGIVNSESAIPSTFDGLDQIASLLARLKDVKS